MSRYGIAEQLTPIQRHLLAQVAEYAAVAPEDLPPKGEYPVSIDNLNVRGFMVKVGDPVLKKDLVRKSDPLELLTLALDAPEGTTIEELVEHHTELVADEDEAARIKESAKGLKQQIKDLDAQHHGVSTTYAKPRLSLQAPQK